MANFIGYTTEQRIAVEHAAKRELREMIQHGGLKCNQGGCHTRHAEFCAVDSEYEDIVDRLKDSMFAQGDE